MRVKKRRTSVVINDTGVSCENVVSTKIEVDTSVCLRH